MVTKDMSEAVFSNEDSNRADCVKVNNMITKAWLEGSSNWEVKSTKIYRKWWFFGPYVCKTILYK